jgi:hypothetical protein
MMSFAVALEGMTLVAYIVIIKGGRQKRETGWSILSLLLLLTGLVQCGSMAIVVRQQPPFSRISWRCGNH